MFLSRNLYLYFKYFSMIAASISISGKF